MKDRIGTLTEAFQRADADDSGDVDENEHRTAQDPIAANAEQAARGTSDQEAVSRDSSGMSDDGTGTDVPTIEGYEMPMNRLTPDEPAVHFTYA